MFFIVKIISSSVGPYDLLIQALFSVVTDYWNMSQFPYQEVLIVLSKEVQGKRKKASETDTSLILCLTSYQLCQWQITNFSETVSLSEYDR